MDWADPIMLAGIFIGLASIALFVRQIARRGLQRARETQRLEGVADIAGQAAIFGGAVRVQFGNAATLIRDKTLPPDRWPSLLFGAATLLVFGFQLGNWTCVGNCIASEPPSIRRAARSRRVHDGGGGCLGTTRTPCSQWRCMPMSRPPLPPFTAERRHRRRALPRMPGTRAIRRASHLPMRSTDGGETARRAVSINDGPIKESERNYHWPLGRRPTGIPP